MVNMRTFTKVPFMQLRLRKTIYQKQISTGSNLFLVIHDASVLLFNTLTSTVISQGFIICSIPAVL